MSRATSLRNAELARKAAKEKPHAAEHYKTVERYWRGLANRTK